MCIGSCFAENIHTRLYQHGFSSLENPNGILFNPISMLNCINDLLKYPDTPEQELFEYKGLWYSWRHHGRFAAGSRKALQHQIEESHKKAQAHLKSASWLVLTFGSAYVYKLKENKMIVGNCHKVPQNLFEKSMLSVNEITEAFSALFNVLQKFNPDLNILMSVSPVRYLRDGLVENNLSKSVLLQSVHEMCRCYENVTYFPAYEIVVDELRDYRFYAEDMVHPNQLAIDYVWEQFVANMLDGPAQKYVYDMAAYNRLQAHKPLHPESDECAVFERKKEQQWLELKKKYPWIQP